MESIAICIDNSIDYGDDLGIPFSQLDLRQQFMVVTDICKSLWQTNSLTKVSILVFAPSSGHVVQDFTTDVSKVIQAFSMISLVKDMDFINCLKIAFQSLAKSRSPNQRMILFVKNKIFCSDNELKLLTTNLLNSSPLSTNLYIDVISIGHNLIHNRTKFKTINDWLKNKGLICYECPLIDRIKILRHLYGTRVFEIRPSDHIDLIEQIEDGSSGNVVLDNRGIEDRLYSIEVQRNAINNDKGIDSHTRYQILQELDTQLNALEQGNFGEQMALKTDGAMDDTDGTDLEKAIQNSLTENYKIAIEDVVKNMCDSFKEHTIKTTINKQTETAKGKTTKVKKFREKTKC